MGTPEHPGGAKITRVEPFIVALTDGATIAVDLSLGDLFRVTLGGNRTLSNPTNAVDGQRFMVEFKQDGTGSRTISWGTNYKFGTDLTGITLTTAPNLTDKVLFQVRGSYMDIIAFIKGFPA